MTTDKDSVHRERFFDIETDSDRRFIHFTLRGTWDLALVDDFAATYRPIVAKMRAGSGIDYSLVDALEFGELTTDLAERFLTLVETHEEAQRTRTAIIMNGFFNRAHARDVAALANARFFHDDATAREWLFGTEP